MKKCKEALWLVTTIRYHLAFTNRYHITPACFLAMTEPAGVMIRARLLPPTSIPNITAAILGNIILFQLLMIDDIVLFHFIYQCFCISFHEQNFAVALFEKTFLDHVIEEPS